MLPSRSPQATGHVLNSAGSCSCIKVHKSLLLSWNLQALTSALRSICFCTPPDPVPILRSASPCSSFKIYLCYIQEESTSIPSMVLLVFRATSSCPRIVLLSWWSRQAQTGSSPQDKSSSLHPNIYSFSKIFFSFSLFYSIFCFCYSDPPASHLSQKEYKLGKVKLNMSFLQDT